MSSRRTTSADSGQPRACDLAYVAHFARVTRLAEPGEITGHWIDSARTGPDAVSEPVDTATGAVLGSSAAKPPLPV